MRALALWLFVAAFPVDAGELRLHVPTTVRIPAGSFAMGAGTAMVTEAARLCRAEARFAATCEPEMLVADELPAHRVRIAAFAIDRTEVSQADYARCVLAGACAPTAIGLGDPRLDGETLPVVGIAWQDAVRYCAFAGGRLPTEAEWERAARGDDAQLYPWGRTWDPGRANHGRVVSDGAGFRIEPDPRDGYEGLSPVGMPATDVSPFGVVGMAGNVREWTADVYDAEYYAHAPPSNPRGPAGSGRRVVRGGSYIASSLEARTTARLGVPETLRSEEIGVRCAYEVAP